MQRFLRRRTFKNYGELLAKERAETERLFILKVLARKGAKKPPPLGARMNDLRPSRPLVPPSAFG
jgi:hypothetical protein